MSNEVYSEVSVICFVLQLVKCMLLQAVQRGCGVSLLGDCHKASGCGPGHPVLGGPAGAGVWTRWPLELPSDLNHSVVLKTYWKLIEQYCRELKQL